LSETLVCVYQTARRRIRDERTHGMNRPGILTPQTFAVKVLALGQWRASAHKNVLGRHIRRIPSLRNPADLREVTKL